MKSVHTQSAITTLNKLASAYIFDAAQFDEAIDILENIKQELNVDDDESIDTIDEIQDYLQYILTVNDLSMEEIGTELHRIIQDLKKNSE